MYTYDDFSAARSHLTGRTFAGMKGYDAYHYLEQPLLDYMRESAALPSGVGWLFPYLANNFEFVLKDRSQGKNVFYYSSYYQTRKDCLAFLEKITGAIDDPLAIVGSASKRTRLSNVFGLFRYLSWTFALRGMKLDKKGKRYLKYRLAFCVNFRRFIEKNGALLPSMVTKTSKKVVWWKCEQGHEWTASIDSKNRASIPRCPICLGRKKYKGDN